MKKYYYLALVCHNNTVPIIVKDSSIIFLIDRVSRMLSCSFDKKVSINVGLPRGAIKDRWCLIGSAEICQKINLTSEPSCKIDFYLTRSKTGVLASLITKKAKLISNPVGASEFFVDENQFMSLEFIARAKFYKCEVDLVFLQSGSTL